MGIHYYHIMHCCAIVKIWGKNKAKKKLEVCGKMGIAKK